MIIIISVEIESHIDNLRFFFFPPYKYFFLRNPSSYYDGLDESTEEKPPY